jgi:hypothetical protein
MVSKAYQSLNKKKEAILGRGSRKGNKNRASENEFSGLFWFFF